MRAQILLAVTQAQLGTNIVPVKENGVFRKQQQLSDILVGPAFSDEVRHPDLRGGEIVMARRQAAGEG